MPNLLLPFILSTYTGEVYENIRAISLSIIDLLCKVQFSFAKPMNIDLAINCDEVQSHFLLWVQVSWMFLFSAI
jgi:hypothetical protein